MCRSRYSVDGDIDTAVQESLYYHYHGEISAGCCCVPSHHVTLMVTLTLLYRSLCTTMRRSVRAVVACRHVTSHNVNGDVDPVLQESLHCHVKISAGCCCVFSHHVTLMVTLTLLCRSLCITTGRSARAVAACRQGGSAGGSAPTTGASCLAPTSCSTPR